MEERPLILITGANGQLGQAFRAIASDFSDIDFLFFDRSKLDITNAKACRKVLEEVLPDIVINCAAYTNVEKAEDEKDLAMLQNATAPAFLAVACSLTGARLIHFSTDYVFDGLQKLPYSESDATGPLSVYGESKLAGERGIVSAGGDFWILRVAWLYSPFAHNFYKTMIKLGREKPELNVVNDQWGCPTNALVLAADVLAICRKTLFDSSFDLPFGIYHYAHAGFTSWHGFAQSILQKWGINIPINPVPSSAFPTKAKRPTYSILNTERLFNATGLQPIDWSVALDRCVETHTKIENLQQ